MDFALTDEQQQIRDEVLKLCARFDDAYWLERDRTANFPDAFFTAMAEANWLGIAMPEEYGGAGLGITEAQKVDTTPLAEQRGAEASTPKQHPHPAARHPRRLAGSPQARVRCRR